MNNEEMVMNVAETTSIDNSQNIVSGTPLVPMTNTTVSSTNPQVIIPEKTRTIIRKYNRKVSRNETCPCGSGKKYKNCCHPKYNETRQLTKEEVYNLKYLRNKIDDFKEVV